MLQRKLVMRGHKHNHRILSPPSSAQHAETVQLGHLHVQKTRSGGAFWLAATASRPSAHSPTSSISARPAAIGRKTGSRPSGSSSTMSVRTFMALVPSERDRQPRQQSASRGIEQFKTVGFAVERLQPRPRVGKAHASAVGGLAGSPLPLSLTSKTRVSAACRARNSDAPRLGMGLDAWRTAFSTSGCKNEVRDPGIERSAATSTFPSAGRQNGFGSISR